MSIRIMSQIFDSETLEATPRLIMLALADHADDTGRCYPSIQRLCQRTGLKERAVQNNLSKLQEAGYLRVIQRAGRNGTNVYFITAHPALNAPPHEMHPASGAPTPRTKCGSDPARDAPKPSVTINEPSNIDTRAKPSKRKTSIPEDAVISEKMLSIAESLGITKQEAVAQFGRFKSSAEARGAQYVNWDSAWRNWLTSPYFKPMTGGPNGNGNNHNNGTAQNGRGMAATAADQDIADFAIRYTASRQEGSADCSPAGYDEFKN